MRLVEKYRSTLDHIQTLNLLDTSKHTIKRDKYGYCDYKNENERFFVDFNSYRPILCGYVTAKAEDGSYAHFIFRYKKKNVFVIFELDSRDTVINSTLFE